MNVGDVLTLAGTQGGRDLPSSFLHRHRHFHRHRSGRFRQSGPGDQHHRRGPGTPRPERPCRRPAQPSQLTIIGNTGTENALTLGSQGLRRQRHRHKSLHHRRRAPTARSPTIPPAKARTQPSRAFDSLGNPVTINLTTVLESTSAHRRHRLAILRHQPEQSRRKRPRSSAAEH